MSFEPFIIDESHEYNYVLVNPPPPPPNPPVSVPLVPVVPKKTYMDIIRCFTHSFIIQVESSYNSEPSVISENKDTFAFTIGNVKFINVILGNNFFKYNVETSSVEKSSFGNGITQNGDNIDVAVSNWTYRIDLSNKSAIAFSNVDIPADALSKMIHYN